MPGFPFGPVRPNTRAALPWTSRVLVPAVRRNSAPRVSGAAVTRAIRSKGIAPAIATPDARIWRRLGSVGVSFSLMAACPFRSRSESWPPIQFDACPGLPRLACDCRIYRTAAPITSCTRCHRHSLASRRATRDAPRGHQSYSSNGQRNELHAIGCLHPHQHGTLALRSCLGPRLAHVARVTDRSAADINDDIAGLEAVF